MRFLTKYLAIVILAAMVVSCGGEKKEKKTKRQFKTSKTVSKSKKSVKKASKTKTIDPAILANKGIGPIKEYTLPTAIDPTMVTAGKKLFKSKCSACHRTKRKFIGPALKGLLERRSPEWAMNMIMNPEEMLQKDPIAKQLMIDFNGAPMANQNLNEQQTKEVLEFIRSIK
ncbi:MAG: cytochrome c [Flavobacteriaceae bacterium]|nr:cytochrome c [Flavobacteriaceae bacterium]